ncbi:MAG: siroheme synthase CysG [Proteobacteria bacterium]|nr:siroheme synthase CysG [Pseudomonadota bacterium]
MTETAFRIPKAGHAPRMAPLAVLPVFLKLAGRRVVVAGGSEAAVWKAELLAAAGARVEVFAGSPCGAMIALAEASNGAITLHPLEWKPGDLTGASFAIGAMVGDAEAARFRDAARNAGVPVNVIDKPEFCDVQFGGIVNRSPLVIGISTDGAAPVFGQAVRARIEAVLPQGLARWAEAAKAWRGWLASLALPFHARRRFWDRFARQALAEPERVPTAALAERLESEAVAAAAVTSGRILLVGAGPGDPELLTMKAVRALQSADVIVHDDLVPSAVLDVARRESLRISAGKRGRGPSCRQEDINALVIRLAREGRCVVRLKSGDPMIFGRAGEEIAATGAAGIPVEVVPGISAAQGASAALGLSLTHRDHARRLQYVTAHGRDGRLPSDLHWPALADPAASTVVYMAGGTWLDMAARLVGTGLDPHTPAVAVVNATRADQVVIASTVAALGQELAAGQWCGPLLILYGSAFAEPKAVTESIAAAFSDA